MRRFALPILVLAAAACSDGSPTQTEPPFCAAAPVPAAAPAAAVELDPAFALAAAEFGVPTALLKAIGYVETRWQMVDGHTELGQPATYGVMALREGEVARAAALAGIPAEAARSEPEANIRAAAALLRAYADELALHTADLGAWAPVVARYSGITLPAGRASYVHDDVYAVLRRGVEVAGVAALPAIDARPAYPRPTPATYGTSGADYSGALWYPSPNHNQRPAGDIGRVAMVIIHTCEGAYTGCWSWLANPDSRVSAHYVVKEDGSEVRQLVHDADRAWHIGSAYDCALNAGHDCWRNGQSNNHFTIGIEHAGYAAQSSWPATQIDASARLVCDLSRRHSIPIDRIHVLAHAQLQPHNRTDPGPNWPWADYLARIRLHCGCAATAAR